MREIERFTDMARMPYDFDEIDVEVAKELTPQEPVHQIASSLARSALMNDKWRSSFESAGQRFLSPPPHGSPLMGIPRTPLNSQEMTEWASMAREALSVKKPGATLSFLRLLAGPLLPFVALSYFVIIELARLDTLGSPNWAHSIWAEIALGVVFFIPLPWLAEVIFRKNLAARLALVISIEFFALNVYESSRVNLAFLAAFIIPAFLVFLEKRFALAEKSKLSLPTSRPSSWVEGSTRYGSSTLDPRSAASDLRLVAESAGVELRKDVKISDLAASVIVADAWAFYYGAQHLDQAAAYGPESIAMLAPAIARAAGLATTSPSPEDEPQFFPGLKEAFIEWDQWLASFLDNSNKSAVWEQVMRDLNWYGPGSSGAKMALSLKNLCS